jgi:signal transduction histidine kinase
MTGLIEQLLTLARVEQRGFDAFAPVALDKLLCDIASELQPKADGRGINLQVSIHTSAVRNAKFTRRQRLTSPGELIRL